MGSALRWLLTGILILAVILATAVTLVLAGGLEVDLTPLRGSLQRVASAALGRPLTIATGITLSGGDGPTLVLNGVQLAPPADPGALATVNIAQLRIKLDIPGLLRGRTPIGGFELTDADTQLVTADGSQSFPARIARAGAQWSGTGVFTLDAEGTVADRPLRLAVQTGATGDESLTFELLLVLGATRVEADGRLPAPPDPNDLRLQALTIRYTENDAQGTLQANSLRLLERRTLIADVLTVSDLRGQIQLGRDGRWHLPGDLGNLPLWVEDDNAAARPDTTSTATGGITVQVGKLITRGDNRVLIEDPNTEPPLRWHLTLSELTLEELDTSSPIPVSRLQLSGRIDEQAALSLLDIPGSGKGSQSLTGELRAFQLPILSAYTRATGFSIENGRMDAKLRARIAGNVIDGTIQATTLGLAITTRDPERPAATEQTLPISLETGLRRLTENDGTIRFTIPVTGTLDRLGLALDLDLDIEAAVSRALGDVIDFKTPGPGSGPVEPVPVTCSSSRGVGLRRSSVCE